MGNNQAELINIAKNNKLYGKNTDRLMRFFNLGVTTKNQMIPVENVLDKKGNPTDKIRPIEMPSALENAYQYLISNMNCAPYMDNQFRFLRYKDFQSAFETEPILNNARLIYVSEAYTSEHGKNLVGIKAKDSKVEKNFYTWFENVGFTENVIRDIFSNLVIFGDSFWINGIDMEGNGGITTITPISPYLVAERIEFNVGIVEEKRNWFNMSLNLANTYPALQQIVDIVSQKNVEDISMFYKSYLFGYTLKLFADEENGNSQDVNKNVKGVPPWVIGHCRLFTTDKAFAPYGLPMMMSAIPAYKSYKTTQLLIDMLRSQSFPREYYQIKCDENSDPFTRNMRISEAKNFLEGITPQTQNQDGLSVGSKIYGCDGLVDFDLLDPSIDLDALGDLEEKKNSLCMATGIPLDYLLPQDGGLGGDYAEKLYYLNKVFQRRVDALRCAFLETLTETYRMHLMLTNQFDGDKTEFELYIENPVEDMTSDKISQISDVFSLAKDILDTLATSFGLERGESLSPKIVKSILSQYLPVEKDMISQWVDEVYGCAEEENKNDNSEEEDGKPKDNMFGKKPNLFESRMKEKQIMEKFEECKEKINEEYFKFKREHGMCNGVIGNKLYYNNTYSLKANYKNSTLALLKEQINMNKAQRLKEELEEKK